MTQYQVQNKNNCNTSNYWLQYLAAFTACMSVLTCGLHYAWTSPTLPKLYADNSPIPIDSDQGSWIVIAPLIAAMGGATMSSFICNIIGRKFIILLTTPIYFASWIAIALADSYPILLFARAIAGFSDGITYTTVPIYICEIADSKIRGALGSMVPVTLILGVLFINVLAPFFDIPTMAYICSIVPVAQAAIFVWMPESPYQLLMKEKFEKAKSSLQRLRRTKFVQFELDRLKLAVAKQMSESSSLWDLFTVKSNRKGLLYAIGLRTFQQLTGATAFIFYTQIIFKEATDDLSPEMSAIIYSSIQFLIGIFSTVIVDIVGRKPLLMFSSFGCAVTLFIEGTYFYLKDNTAIDLDGVYLLPVVTMLVFVLIFGIGLSTVPVLMLGELFPTNVKTYALGFMDIYFSLVASITAKVFQVTSDMYGMYVPFYLFSICSAGSIVFSYFVPETKGKTLEEIQMKLKNIKLDINVKRSTEEKY